MKNILLAISIFSSFSLLVADFVFAQTVQSGMTENTCPEQEPSGAPPEFLKAMMEPGAKMPPMPSGEAFEAMMKRQAESRANDFGNLCRFKNDNSRLTQKEIKVVFMGDSITQGWEVGDASLFVNGVVDRGIGGQTSPQMLLRFYQDVVALHPKVVHIMAGTNDLAGNTGPNSPEDFKNNIRAMVDLAVANNINVVLASILPVTSFPWQPDSNAAKMIPELNTWLKQFAAERNLVYADYYSATATEDGKFKPSLSNDGVHPHIDGYRIMRPITDAALQQAMKDN